MSGIVGIWNLDGEPLEQAVLTRLSAALAHRGGDAEGSWIQGPVGLACQLRRVTPEAATEIQPLVDASSVVVVFDGRLDNREELLDRLRTCPGISRHSPDSVLVRAAYEAFDERMPEHLTGDFALGLYDPRRHQLLLARDAIGVRPLYYVHDGKRFRFASEIKALFVDPHWSPRPNDQVLAEFLFLRLSGLEERGLTFFDGVYSLAPGHMAVVTTQKRIIRRYWDFDPMRRTRLSSFQEYTEGFRHYFRQAVRRRLRSAHPVAVAVSGGLDSSAILCVAEALKQGDPHNVPGVFGVSYLSDDGTPSDEKAFLLEIERAYGSSIERLGVAPGMAEDCAQQVWHVETPFLDTQWNTTRALLQCARQRRARVLLTGHWGDQVLFDQAYLMDLFRGLAWRQLWGHLQEFRRWMTDVDPGYFRRRFLGDLIRYPVPARLVPWLQAIKVRVARNTRTRGWYTKAFRARARRSAPTSYALQRPFATAHARSLYQMARCRYHVLCMEWNDKAAHMHGVEHAFPFLDRELIAFLMGIPGEMQTWKGVPKALLRTAMCDVVPSAILERRTKADFTARINAGVARDYPRLVDRLQSGRMAVAMGYVKEDLKAEDSTTLMTRMGTSSCKMAWNLGDLLGLELWLQVFFGRSSIKKEG